jgi:hypothetical protein
VEAHVLAMNRALIGRGVYNLDEFRDAVERDPDDCWPCRGVARCSADVGLAPLIEIVLIAMAH